MAHLATMLVTFRVVGQCKDITDKANPRYVTELKVLDEGLGPTNGAATVKNYSAYNDHSAPANSRVGDTISLPMYLGRGLLWFSEREAELVEMFSRYSAR
ncbi:MAG: hypothetical protein AABX13_06005 [Nanoarchaeota archaeon]